MQIGLGLCDAALEQMQPGRTIDDVSTALLTVIRDTAFEADYCPGGFDHGIGLAVIEPSGLVAGTRSSCGSCRVTPH